MRLLSIIVFVTALVGAASVAHAQDGDQAARHAQREACRLELERMSKEAREEASKAGEARAQLGPVTRVARLASAMPQCLEELQDASFSAELDKVLVRKVQEEEADRYTRDQRHVILAYIAIWILTAGFVAFLFLRQGKLRGEIERLRAELARAVKDADK